MSSQRNNNSKARYDKFIEGVVQGGAIWIAESADAIMILSSEDGEDGLAMWSSSSEVHSAFSEAEVRRGYESLSHDLQDFLCVWINRMEKNNLLAAVCPIDGCTKAVFVESDKVRHDIRLKLNQSQLVLQSTALRRAAKRIKKSG